MINSCKICDYQQRKVFEEVILDRHSVSYLKCDNCGYLCTENPFWLEEAYTNAVADADTGIFLRNIAFSQQVGLLLLILNGVSSSFQQQCLDYAGGYGVFVRLMRDLGFNFFWMDKYCHNLFAKSYEGKLDNKYSIVTSFEFIEHTVNPMEEIKNIFNKTDTWIFSTELLPSDIPDVSWWYYSFSTGQHISFFSKKTFENIATQLNINYYNFGVLHILTKMKIGRLKLLYIKLCCFTKISFIIKYVVKKFYYSQHSLTVNDMHNIANKINLGK